MEAWLSRHGIEATVRDVHDDLDAYDELIALGFRMVPVTVIADRAIRGFDEPTLRVALEAAGWRLAKPNAMPDET